jgi:protein SCO1/2
VAYTETESGELIPADGNRATGSTAAAVRQPRGADEEWLKSFDLIERSGASVTSEDLKGQPYVLSFFFSMCPTICVQQNEKVQLLQDKFAGQPIRLVSITCDPAMDRPEVLAKYADRFEADPEQWLFLTGDLPYIRRVGAEMFALPVDLRFHAEKFVLVDATGEIFGYYTWTDDVQWQQLQTDMAKLLSGEVDDKPDAEITNDAE